MKTLMMTTALALALGLSSGASALTNSKVNLANAPLMEINLQTETSLFDANDFYQGDYLMGSKSSLNNLTECDLYTGRGASEVPAIRWVTD